MKHTPGPWLIDRYHVGDVITVSRCFHSFKTDIIVGKYENEDIRPEQYDQDQVDARLIAAAPELLAACQLAYDILGDGILNIPLHSKRVIAALDACRGAIIKAGATDEYIQGNE